MIGVVIPANDDEHFIARCLTCVQSAAGAAQLQQEAVLIVVVLDASTDRTGAIALAHGATLVECSARNVGVARAAGAQACLDAGARWLAFTDADTEVDTDWLVQQLQLAADAVCGTVRVRDWGLYAPAMRRHYDDSYTDADGQRHIHGANLGVSAQAYRLAGGFPPIPCSEDVALVRSLEALGARIAWSARPTVWVSERRTLGSGN